MTALNQMLDVDIKKLLGRCVVGCFLDLGKSVKQDDVDIIVDRVMAHLKYKSELMNISSEAVEQIFMRASMGEYRNKMGTAEAVNPANVITWISATYSDLKKRNESIRREQERKEFDDMCKTVTSLQKHPAAAAAAWLIKHGNDRRFKELQDAGLTRENVYQLSYKAFDLDRMFYLFGLSVEYKLVSKGMKETLSSKLHEVVKRNNALEMMFLRLDFSALPSGFRIPITREQVFEVDRIYLQR